MKLIVKTKENNNEELTTFEVLTRTPFKGYDFHMMNYDFKDKFRYVNDPEVNMNSSEFDRSEEGSVYMCIKKNFFEKMLWWEKHILKIEILENEKPSIENMDLMDKYNGEYTQKFDCDIFQMFQDRKYFRDLFETGKEVTHAE